MGQWAPPLQVLPLLPLEEEEEGNEAGAFGRLGTEQGHRRLLEVLLLAVIAVGACKRAEAVTRRERAPEVVALPQGLLYRPMQAAALVAAGQGGRWSE